MKSKFGNGVAVFGVLIIFILIYCIVSFGVTGCSVAPRDTVYCVKNGLWVKCPKDVLPGTEL